MSTHIQLNTTKMNATLNFFGLREKQELLSIFLVFLSIIILLGNGIIILAVIRYKHLRTPTNQFVAVLALADIMMALSLPYQIVYYLSPSLYTVKYACLMRYITFLLPCGTSLTHIGAITIDRFFSVFRPLQYATIMTNRRVFLISAFLWSYSLVLGFVPLYWNNWHRTQTCVLTHVLTPGYIIILLAHFFFISLLIVVLYARMFAVTSRHQRDETVQTTRLFGYVPRGSQPRKIRSLLLYGLIVCSFCLLWTPFFVVLLIQMLWFNDKDIFTAGRIATLLGLISSVINPVIYVALNKTFRKTILKMFRSLFANRIEKKSKATKQKPFCPIWKLYSNGT